MRRRGLLLGTALATTLIALPMLTATPARAQANCPGGNAPIDINTNQPIVCNNANDRTNNAGDAIRLETTGDGSYIIVDNSGDLTAINNAGDARGIYAYTNDANSPVTIVNRGDIQVSASDDGYGIYAYSDDEFSDVTVNNSGAITVTAGRDGYGILAETSTSADDSAVTVINSGAITVNAVRDATGIYAYNDGANGPVSVINSGPITVNAGDAAQGIYAYSFDENSPISVTNSGDITLSAGGSGYGIYATNGDVNSSITISNSGDIVVTAAVDAYGIYADGDADYGAVTVTNSGNITVSAGQDGYGIHADSDNPNSPITIVNSGNITVSAVGVSVGIFADSNSAKVSIANLAGGVISSSSGLAIDVDSGGSGQAFVYNAGTINGFVDLTDNNDLFQNLQGGVFNAAGTSLFRDGADKFQNRGLVQIGSNGGVAETAAFEELETFENDGVISLVDGGAGDSFTISNNLPAFDLLYVGGPGSVLAVDAVLNDGGSSDTFTIEGSVSGQTIVQVNNIAGAPSMFTTDTIPVIFVNGPNVDGSNFVLERPIDAGFFNYDLFFVPTNSGFFELRNIGPGGGAFLLPQLITASQDIWHETSDTWFDRSADLRSALRHGGSVPGVPGAMYLGGGSVKDGAVSAPGGLSPAVWAKVSHGELEQDDTARTSAFGRSFSYNLDRDLYIIDIQSGVDFALKGVMNPSDVLLFSVFGGGVSANLTYDNLGGRRFDYEGGQVGVAATYMSGGLFVDALFNAQFLQIEPKAFGFSEDLDADTYGFRVDTGYRFERNRFFFEPLLTLAYVDSDIDGFSFAGNTVSFQAEDSLRGRVGLRAGTSLTMAAVRFEPFVIASLWGELSDDDNRATLTSNGARFGFSDEREDSWGEISLGTNTFLAGSNAVSAFSKVDLVFGEDTEGYMASGGFRVQW